MEKNLLKISESELTGFFKSVYDVLNKTSYSKAVSREKSADLPARRSVAYGSYSGQATQMNFSVINTIKDIDETNPLMSDVQHHMITVLQQGISLAAVMSDNFEKRTPLERLKGENAKSVLVGSDKATFSELKMTQAYISLFTMANFIQSKIAEIASPLECAYDEKVILNDSLISTKQFLYQLNNAIEANVKDDNALQKAIKTLCLSLIDQLKQRESSLTHTESFIDKNFHSELLDTEISGFTVLSANQQAELTMTFKKPEEVIGNKIAKYQMKKLAKMMMCYDFKTQQNPFNELGGFIFTFMGDGMPGTGKTTLIQMLAGLLHEYCQTASYPFYYENFSVDQIDSYQGASGQHAKQFIRNVTNPNVIGFGTIDDIDQIAGKRGDNKSSAGQQEVTAVLMESLAGANTVVRGNCTIGMFSNYPENVDDALRQRAGARYLIDGPITSEDFTDLLALLLKKQAEIEVGDIELNANQHIDERITQSYDVHNEPETSRLKEVFVKATEELGTIDNLKKFGKYLKMIQDAEPRFTGRAIKNIADAAKTRAMDVDLPDAWFEDKETFFDKSYEEKLEMISQFAKPVTAHMLLQELHRYADSEFRYSANSDDATVDDIVRNMKQHKKAELQYNNDNS